MQTTNIGLTALVTVQTSCKSRSARYSPSVSQSSIPANYGGGYPDPSPLPTQAQPGPTLVSFPLNGGRAKPKTPAPLVPARLSAVAAGTRDLLVRLDAGIAPTLRILDPEGKPVSRAEVEVEGSGDGPWLALRGSGAGGYAVLPPLDPRGEYRLTVRPPFGSRGLEKVVLDPWTPGSECVVLPRRR